MINCYSCHYVAGQLGGYIVTGPRLSVDEIAARRTAHADTVHARTAEWDAVVRLLGGAWKVRASRIDDRAGGSDAATGRFWKVG